MYVTDVLKYGHVFMEEAIDGLPDEVWATSGVCGVWSVRDIIGHLAISEYLLAEIFNMFLDGGPTPYMELFAKIGPEEFNDVTVPEFKDRSGADAWADYSAAYEKVMALAERMPAEKWAEVGAIPWYGPDYSLEDLIVYGFYGHKREHGAQVNVFKDQLKGA